MKLKALIGSGIIAGSLAVSSVAGAAVTFDPDKGTGFVGKGDVQLVYGWNNKVLQDNANSVKFQYVGISTTVTEVSWECTNNSNQKVQERERTTTTETSISGVVTTVARERNQITGFSLTEYASVKEESTVATDGPTVNSCSNNSTLTKRAGDPVVDQEASTSTGGLQVSTDGQNWTDI